MLHNKLRFVLVNVADPVLNHEAALFNLEELKSLVSTFGGATIVRVVQRRQRPDPATYLGAGKTLELAQIVSNEKIDAVVLNGTLNSGQIFRLEKILWSANPNIKVWDRVDLILNIFDKHASTSEAKLQIELARMRHMGPRMYGLGGTLLSRQTGGIGLRGIGETNVELMKRHWRSAIKNTQNKLKKITKDRSQQLLRRKENGLKTISIIGYTNAGKTTLFNQLTGKNKLTKNVLFATLDSNVGKMQSCDLQREFLVSDTIGFIQNLPLTLIEAFQSTLLESIHADLLLHVIDAADILMHTKIEVVENILKELNIHHKRKIYVFNKVDLAQKLNGSNHLNKIEIKELYNAYNPHFISAKNDSGLTKLKKTIEDCLKRS